MKVSGVCESSVLFAGSLGVVSKTLSNFSGFSVVSKLLLLRRKSLVSYMECIHGCGIEYCKNHSFPSIITSLPDMSEVDMEEQDYISFLRTTIPIILSSVEPKGYAIFIQTDRKHKGLIDKSYYLTESAYALGMRMMFHKICLIRDVDSNDKYKPTYSHILCYSLKGTPGGSTPDIFHRGDTLYKHGMGTIACTKCLEFLQKHKISHVCDPFVGQGTTLILAKQLGFTGVGIDIDETQIEKCRKNIVS